MCFTLYHAAGNVNFFKSDIGRSCDADDNAACTCNGCFEKRTGDSRLCSKLCLFLAGCASNAHVSVSCIKHDSGNVRKVEVDETVNCDKFSNALYTMTKYIVCNLECVDKCDSCIRYLLKSLVGDDNKRVNNLDKVLDSCLCLRHTYLTLKCERFGNNADSEYSHIACGLCNDRSRTCTGTAAHTCGDEYHMSTFKNLLDFFNRLLSSSCTYLGISTCAASLGDLFADIYFGNSARSCECLSVCVDSNKLNAANISRDHAVDSIVSAAADTDYFYIYIAEIVLFKCHFCYPPKNFYVRSSKSFDKKYLYIII